MFVGLHADHTELFWKLYGVHVPGYFFNPKYKLGQWDGKIRYFQKTGKTYVKILDEIVPKVLSLGYKIAIEDRRTTVHVTPQHIDKDFFAHVEDPLQPGQPWQVRDYQIELVNTLIDEAGGVATAGTGSGKTSMVAALVRAYELAGNLRSIIIVPDKNLTAQTKRTYSYFGLDVGEYSGTLKDLKHQHIVSTWQALKNVPDVIKDFQVVVVDECHGCRGNVLQNLLNEYGKHIPYRFGVTGTLPKEESELMATKICIGTVKYAIPAHKLIKANVLSDLHIEILQHEIDLAKPYEDYLTQNPVPPIMSYKKFHDSYFAEWGPEKKYLQNRKDRTKWIANLITGLRDQHKGNTLVLVNGIKYGERLQKLIDNSTFIYGEDDMDTRQRAYNLFAETNDATVIATINIASTGLDIPRIFNLVYIDVGKSFVRVIQSIGRGLRKAIDKDFVNVWDICSDLKYSKSHLRSRIKYYKEAQYPHTKTTIKLRKEDVNI